MSAPRRYPAELRERATKLVLEALKDPESGKGAIGRIGAQLGVNAETLRTWVRQAEVDAGSRPGVTTPDQQRIKALETENKELRRANAILKSASAFFAAEPGRPSR